MSYERCWHIFSLDNYFKTFLFFGKEKVNLTIPHCIFSLKFKLKYNEKNSIYITELKIKAIEDNAKDFFFLYNCCCVRHPDHVGLVGWIPQLTTSSGSSLLTQKLIYWKMTCLRTCWQRERKWWEWVLLLYSSSQL